MILKRICVFCGSSPGPGSALRQSRSGAWPRARRPRNRAGLRRRLNRPDGHPGRRGAGRGRPRHRHHPSRAGSEGSGASRPLRAPCCRNHARTKTANGRARQRVYCVARGLWNPRRLTWLQLGLHRKACALLNVAGFYDPLLAFFDHALAEGFLKPAHRGLVLADTNPLSLIDRLSRTEVPVVEKWIGPADT